MPLPYSKILKVSMQRPESVLRFICIPLNRAGSVSNGKSDVCKGLSIVQQEDLSDLITALLKLNCFLSTTVAKQCTFLQPSVYNKSVSSNL